MASDPQARTLDRWTVGVAALGTLALYTASLSPTVTFGGDCGELTAAAYVLGVPHPTGYPLYCLLAKLTTLVVPFGSIAWRVALFSALCAAVAAGTVAWTVLHLTRDRVAALVAAAALVLAPAVWSQLVIAREYGLHLALLALLVALHAVWYTERDPRWLNLLGLAYGLALTNHATTLLLIPGTVLLLLAAERGQVAVVRGALGRLAVWALPPLAIYLYEPLRAGLHPPLSWGHTETVGGFFGHLTGRSYHRLLFGAGLEDTLRFVRNHVLWLALYLRYAALLSVLGLWAAARRQPGLALLLAALAAAALVFAAAYEVGNRGDYALGAYLAAAVLAGLGAAWLRQAVLTRWGSGREAIVHTSLTTLLLLLPFLPSPPEGGALARIAWDHCSLRGNRRAEQLGYAVLDDVAPGGAVAVLSDEEAWACWYAQLVEGRRRDVLVWPLGDLKRPEVRQKAYQVLDGWLTARPAYVAFWDLELAQRYRLSPLRATCRAVAPGTAPPVRLGPLSRSSGQPLPAAPAWGLLDAEVDSAVRVPGELNGRPAQLPALKPRTLGRLRTRLVARNEEPPPMAVAVVLLHESVALKAATPIVLNDAVGEVKRWTVEPLAFEPTTEGYALARGRVLAQDFPLQIPELSLAGRYQVRVGLIGVRDDARWRSVLADPAAAQAATVPVGWVTSYEQ